MCAAAFVGDGEAIAADADGLAFVGDADAARAADDNAAFLTPECAKPGEISIALEPGRSEWMLPGVQGLSGAEMACAGEADACIGALQRLFAKTCLRQSLCGRRKDRGAGGLDAKAHGGRAGDALAQGTAVAGGQPRTASCAAAIHAEIKRFRHGACL